MDRIEICCQIASSARSSPEAWKVQDTLSAPAKINGQQARYNHASGLEASPLLLWRGLINDNNIHTQIQDLCETSAQIVEQIQTGWALLRPLSIGLVQGDHYRVLGKERGLYSHLR